MQTVYKDEDEESGSKRANPVDVIICARRISRYLEREYLGEAGERGIGIQICERVFGSHQKRIWRRGEGVGKDGRVEKIRARRKDNGRIYSRVQESSERKQI